LKNTIPFHSVFRSLPFPSVPFHSWEVLKWNEGGPQIVLRWTKEELKKNKRRTKELKKNKRTKEELKNSSQDY
jgi:hypothetical protein